LYEYQTGMVTTQRPLVSIIVPVYNSDRYIGEAIESILHQTYTNYEIIVVDDGSTDNTRDRLQPYWQKIRYIYQENQGVAAARNRGTSESKGVLIAFLDQDDYYLPHKLASQVACFEAQPSVCIVNSGWCIVDEGGGAIGEINLSQALPNLTMADWILWKPVFLGAMMFDRHCLAQVDGFDPSLHQAPDVDLVLRLVLAGCQSAWTERSTVCYRQHDENASRDALAQAKELQIVLDRLFQRPDLPNEISSLQNQSRYQSLVWSALRLYHYGDLPEMVCYLAKSLSYNFACRTEIILEWLSALKDHAKTYGSKLDVYALTSSKEWQHLLSSILNTY
jgi:glycosyltransferase involved in cell wall biosynthesis